jgi:putative transposase
VVTVPQTHSIWQGSGSFASFGTKSLEHIRTINPIENTFATVRHRSKQSKGFLSREAAFMVFKLIKAAERIWRRLDGKSQLLKVITDVKFCDGHEVTASVQQACCLIIQAEDKMQ